MSEPDDWDVTDAMKQHGGGFVIALAELWRRGDEDNRRRIKAAWPEYWERYAGMARAKGTSK